MESKSLGAYAPVSALLGGGRDRDVKYAPSSFPAGKSVWDRLAVYVNPVYTKFLGVTGGFCLPGYEGLSKLNKALGFEGDYYLFLYGHELFLVAVERPHECYRLDFSQALFVACAWDTRLNGE